MRWMYAKQNPAENLNFGYKSADEVKRKLLTLYNGYIFFTTYVDKRDFPSDFNFLSENILDKWIVSKINHLVGVVEFNLDKYDMAKAASAIEDFFVNDLSLWYIRRTRKRFHSSINLRQADRKEAIETLYNVLLNVAKVIAPIIPFFAEAMYRELKIGNMPESIHLCDWPANTAENFTDLELEQKMDETRNIVSLALAERSANGIKVRQPLALLAIKNKESRIKESAELLELIKDEVNVKEIVFDGKIKKDVELDLNITKELKEEGMAREIVRFIQEIRKDIGLKPVDWILAHIDAPKEISGILEKNKNIIAGEAKIKKYVSGKEIGERAVEKELLLDGQKLLIKISKYV